MCFHKLSRCHTYASLEKVPIKGTVVLKIWASVEVEWTISSRPGQTLSHLGGLKVDVQASLLSHHPLGFNSSQDVPCLHFCVLSPYLVDGYSHFV